MSLLVSAASAFAQTTVDTSCQFVGMNEEGEETGVVYNDGDVVDATIVTDDGFQDPFISSTLGIKNVTDAGKRLYITYTISAMPEGKHKFCFSGQCYYQSAVGNYTYFEFPTQDITDGALVRKRTTMPLQAEWILGDNYGTATVSFQIHYLTYNDETQVYDITGDGPSITVNYKYQDPNAIGGVTTDGEGTATYYDLSGRKVTAPQAGLYIQKTALGGGKVQSRKVMLK